METRKATIESQLAGLADEEKAKVKGALGRINYDSSSDEDTLKAIEEAKLLALGVSHAEKKARKAVAEQSAMKSASVSVTTAPEMEDDDSFVGADKELINIFKGYAQK